MAATPQQPLGDDPGWISALAAAERAAVWPFPVVVRGETGTGKELVAEAYHNASGRKGQFIRVNCGAIPHNMIEYALFGHVRGAYTDAHKDSPGHFRAADGGTLFLDEIGELPLDAQVKLLRVLQDWVIMPVGTSSSVPVDVRVIVATHRDLPAMVASGTFREDLWYRLRKVRIEIPPLRDRKPEDIVLLARAALDRNRLDFSPTDFTPSALAALRRHRWPGNVRELESVVCAALVTHMDRPGDITAAELGIEKPEPRQVVPTDDVPVDYAALVAAHGLRGAARRLGMHHRTVARHLERHPAPPHSSPNPAE